MEPQPVPQPQINFGQPVSARMLARQGCAGCLRQARGCLILIVLVAVVATGGLWVLSTFVHAPLLAFVSPMPYLRQYSFVVHHGQKEVNAVAWSPDGKRVASAGDDGSVDVWDAATDHTSFSYHAKRGVPIPLAWSPDGRHLATADAEHALIVLDAATGKTTFAAPGSGGLHSIAWSPDGQRIAAVNKDHDVQVWAASDGQALTTLSDRTADEVAWSPDGKDLASSSQDGNVRVWALASGRLLLGNTATSLFDYAQGLAWSPDGQRVAAEISAMDSVREQVWDIATGHSVFTYTLPKSRSTEMQAAWSPDSHRLAIGGEMGGPIGVWNISTGKKLLTYGGHQIADFFSGRHSEPVIRAGVETVAWSPDGKRVLSLGIEDSIQIWDPATASPLYVYNTLTDASLVPFHGGFATDGARDVAWSPDGKRVAIAGDNFAEVWKPA